MADVITLAPGDSVPADPNVTAQDAENAGKLIDLGYVADPQTAWSAGQWVLIGVYAFYWDGTAWQPGAVPTPIITASPGMQLPADPAINGSDEYNAFVLDQLPYDAQPHSAWTDMQYVLIGAYAFYWDGAQWQPGSAPSPYVIVVVVTAQQYRPTDLLVQFDASATEITRPGAIPSYLWTFGDGTPDVEGGATPVHQYPAAGLYNVAVTVGDGTSMTASGMVTVSIEPSLPPGQLDQGGTYVDIPGIVASDEANAVRLQLLGYVGSPLYPWETGTSVSVNTFDFHWTGTRWGAGSVPAQPITVAQGSSLPADPQLVGDERSRVQLMAQLGYVADPQEPWRDLAFALIGADMYFWDGREWHLGRAPQPFIILAPGVVDETHAVILDPTWTADDLGWIWRPYYGADPASAWETGEQVIVATHDALRWDGDDWVENLGHAVPGTIFMPNPAITASDPENAAKLHDLGLIAADTAPWAGDSWIYFGEQTMYPFRWSGSAWQSTLEYIPPAKVDTAMLADPRVQTADQSTADTLAGLGYVAEPQTIWETGQKVLIGDVPFHWDGGSWHPRSAPHIAHPGDVFPEDPNIAGQDDYYASMVVVDYRPEPETVWSVNESIKIGVYSFTWNGTGWLPAIT